MKITIPTRELQVGMYVADLDRPWLGTPFLLQGFLIENDEQIRQLQEYCKFLFVDWDRSALELQAAKPASEIEVKAKKPDSITPPSASLSQAPSNTSHTSLSNHSSPESIKAPPADSQPPATENIKNTVLKPAELDHLTLTGTTPQNVDKQRHASPEPYIKTGLLGSFFSKTKGFLKSKAKPKNKFDTQEHTFDSDQHPTTPEVYIVNVQRPDFVPANVELTIYNIVTPVEEELAPANKAYALTDKVLHSLVEDLHSNKNLNIEDVEIVIQDVVNSIVRNPDALMLVMHLRQQDKVSYGHGLQTAVHLIALGRHIGLPKDFLEHLGITGLLLDIGNIKLPNELLKKRNSLTLEEFEIIKSHVYLGLEILKETPNLHNDILEGIAQHHERENGTGYPEGISKDGISLFGRMAAIVDSFTALTNTRINTKAVSPHEALKHISAMRGEYYLDSMVEQFIQTIGIFPVGSLVELSSGEVAVVISQSKVRRLQPRVLIISDPDKRLATHPTTLDLLAQPEMTTAIHILRGLPTGAYDLDAREYYLT